MKNNDLRTISFNLEKLAFFFNLMIPTTVIIFSLLAYYKNQNFYLGAGFFFILTILNFYYRNIQRNHTILSNFGLFGQMRYLIESIGPELRQYWFMSDTEEKPFNRMERSEVYRKSKGIDSSSAFGSLLKYDDTEIKIRHSMYPTQEKDLQEYSCVFGEEQGIKNIYDLKTPIILSAMSYGSLGQKAIQALSKGSAKAKILMNTGEGGYPKYHLMGGADLIFQMGTAKFGVRDDDGKLDIAKLKKISDLDQVKMIEIKFSQGAKPGKGGVLPKEKLTPEICELRNVKPGKDVISPPGHDECDSAKSAVQFIKKIQDISQLPVGIKLCIGKTEEFVDFIKEMKESNIFPDYIAIDGAEGGTGAAPKSFMDDIGLPVLKALPLVQKLLVEHGIRDKMKLLCSGRLIGPSKQIMAMCLGADAVCTARGFMLSIGCIQALECNENSCPVGIATHKKHLQKGLDIDDKSERVYNYVKSLSKDHHQILLAMGKKSFKDLVITDLFNLK